MLDHQVSVSHRKAAETAAVRPLAALAPGRGVCRIGGKGIYLWRAGDDECQVQDLGCSNACCTTNPARRPRRRDILSRNPHPIAIVTPCHGAPGIDDL